MKSFFVRILSFLGCFSPVFGSEFPPICKNVKAIIFDCDGILVDTEYLKFLAWQEALASRGVEFSIEEYIPLVGHSSKNILRGVQELKKIDLDEEVINIRKEKYRLLQAKGVPPIAEMVEFARNLYRDKQKLGLKLAVASSASKEEILNNLEQIGLTGAFDLVISGSDDLDHYFDEEGKNKPKPYIYLEASKRLNVDPKECLVFEDTKAGVDAAADAGMRVIAVPNRFTLTHDFSKASHVVSSPEELKNLK